MYIWKRKFYVDDFVLFGINDTVIDEVIDLLKNHFDLKLLGKTRRLLGVELEEYNGDLRLHQTSYIDEIINTLKKYNIPISSLLIHKCRVYFKTQCPQTENESLEMSRYPYRNLLDYLSFLATRTRPDVSYAINTFSQFQNCPGIIDWNGLLKL